MTSEVPFQAVNTQLVQGSTSPMVATGLPTSGKTVPLGSPSSAAPAPNGAKSDVTSRQKPADTPEAGPVPDLHAPVAQLNKHLHSSGRPNHYRLDSSAGHAVIQELDPDTRKVVSEIPASEFKALAQELGISGLLVDAHA